MWLPAESAFRASLVAEGDFQKAWKFYGWGTSQEFRLMHTNLLLDQIYVLTQANSSKKVQRPEPVTGPYSEPVKKHVRAEDDVSAMAMALMNAQGG